MLRFSGGDSEVATPVPIPNTVVKHLSGDGTAPEKAWESSTLPGSSRLEPLTRFEPHFLFQLGGHVGSDVPLMPPLGKGARLQYI